MSISTLYFSPKLDSWKEQFSPLLSTYKKVADWKLAETIDQCPVSGLMLISENDLDGMNWPLLVTRKVLIITDQWNLNSSIEWIKKGAANSFSRDNKEFIAAWLVSELSKFHTPAFTNDQDFFLQSIIDAIPSPIFFKDEHHIYQGCNTAFCRYIGLDRASILNRSVYDIAPKPLADIYYQADCDLLNSGTTQQYEAEVCFADGTFHKVEFNKAVFKKTDGTIGGQVGVMLDVTERNQLIHQLKAVSLTDPLTQIANRREFDIVIRHELEKSQHFAKKLSLITLDIDHFKRINDQFGHDGGDQALILVVSRLQKLLQTNNSLFRIGGDEFYILMKDCDIKNAFSFAQQLCESVANNKVSIHQHEIQITLSVGVIELDPMTPLNQSLRLVDKALYDAKRNGRNGVSIAT